MRADLFSRAFAQRFQRLDARAGTLSAGLLVPIAFGGRILRA
jgi:hypothetical protein